MKTYRILVLVFCLVGIVFFATGFLGGHFNNQFLQTAEMAQGVVIGRDIGESATTVRFALPGGEAVEGACNYISSDLLVGDEVTVYYDTLDPSRISLERVRVLWLIFECLGGAFLVAALAAQLCGVADEKRKALLLETGREVTAHIDEIRLNRNVTVNNRHPYRIYASAVDEHGDEHHFHSPDLWRDPAPDIRSELVSVRVDGDNWKRYAMDLQTCGVDLTQYETLKAARASRA